MLDLLSSIFAISSPNFILEERFYCIADKCVVYCAVESLRVHTGDIIFMPVFLALVSWQDLTLN